MKHQITKTVKGCIILFNLKKMSQTADEWEEKKFRLMLKRAGIDGNDYDIRSHKPHFISGRGGFLDSQNKFLYIGMT